MWRLVKNKKDVVEKKGPIVRSVVEHSPVGSSASDGVVERGIQSVEAQMRVMRDALEARCGVIIDVNSCIWAWLAEYSAVLLNG